MKDHGKKSRQPDLSPAHPLPARLDEEVNTFRIADWLYQDLLFKAGLSTVSEHSAKDFQTATKRHINHKVFFD